MGQFIESAKSVIEQGLLIPGIGKQSGYKKVRDEQLRPGELMAAVTHKGGLKAVVISSKTDFGDALRNDADFYIIDEDLATKQAA